MSIHPFTTDDPRGVIVTAHYVDLHQADHAITDLTVAIRRLIVAQQHTDQVQDLGTYEPGELAERLVIAEADLDLWVEVRAHMQLDKFRAECGLHCHHITHT